jgi:hypothetical protein
MKRGEASCGRLKTAVMAAVTAGACCDWGVPDV